MKFTKTFSAAIIIAATAGAVSICCAQNSDSAAVTNAQSTAPYTEGAVWQITMVKTKPGMGDDYLNALARIFKSTNEEAKNQCIFNDYTILIGYPSTHQDCDLL